MLALLLAAALHCGAERQDVKTLSDVAARGLHRQLPVKTTIAELVALPTQKWGNAVPRLPEEKRIYSVDGWIVGYKLEADSDVHVVLRDDAGRSVIVEYPAAGCTKRSYAPGLQAQARADIVKILPASPGKYRELAQQPRVEVVGPAFFDKPHGQTGAAPNGIEIHPVLSVKLKE